MAAITIPLSQCRELRRITKGVERRPVWENALLLSSDNEFAGDRSRPKWSDDISKLHELDHAYHHANSNNRYAYIKQDCQGTLTRPTLGPYKLKE